METKLEVIWFEVSSNIVFIDHTNSQQCGKFDCEGVLFLDQTQRAGSGISKLTAKQRECLHLVVLRKSSKEIARILDISKPAVDQRLIGARRVLGAATRNEAALIYAEAAEGYDRILYDPACVPPGADLRSEVNQSERAESFMLEEPNVSYDFGPQSEPQLWSQALKEPRGDLGTVRRLAIIVGITVGILAIVLIGLAVSQSLSGLLAIEGSNQS